MTALDTRPTTACRDTGSPLIRPIRDAAELDEVHRLTYEAYLGCGYCTPQPDGRLIHFPHLDHAPETTVLVAVLDGAIVGTNSVTLDGPAGLHVDGDFRDDCNAIRREDRQGRCLAASWRIATRADLRAERAVVMGLIQETVNLFFHFAVQTCVFTFNPRHERFYQRLLAMETVARKAGSVRGLSNAPAVFMRWDAPRCPERWLGAAGRPRPPAWLSSADERRVDS